MIPYSRSYLTELKKCMKLSAIISQHPRCKQLRRKGKGFVTFSPFSCERRPSLVINDEKGRFACYSSGEGGDAILFIMKTERVEFLEAVQRLVKITGFVPVPRRLRKKKK